MPMVKIQNDHKHSYCHGISLWSVFNLLIYNTNSWVHYIAIYIAAAFN